MTQPDDDIGQGDSSNENSASVDVEAIEDSPDSSTTPSNADRETESDEEISTNLRLGKIGMWLGAEPEKAGNIVGLTICSSLSILLVVVVINGL